MVALTELHHVIEMAAAGCYTPGVVTAIPYIVLGVLFLRALIREAREEITAPTSKPDRTLPAAIA